MYLISEETYRCRGSPKKVTIYPVKRGFVRLKGYHSSSFNQYTPSTKIMSNKSVIRNLVNRALIVKRLTPEIENMINHELSEQGYITDPDYEALEYLMQAVDQGKVRQVS